MVGDLLRNCDDLKFANGYSATATTLVKEDLEMIYKVLAFCKHPKVWVVQTEDVDDYVITIETNIFFSRKDAQDFFDDGVSNILQLDFIKDEYWEVEKSDTSLRAFEDGYYARNHIDLSLREIEIQ